MPFGRNKKKEDSKKELGIRRSTDQPKALVGLDGTSHPYRGSDEVVVLPATSTSPKKQQEAKQLALERAKAEKARVEEEKAKAERAEKARREEKARVEQVKAAAAEKARREEKAAAALAEAEARKREQEEERAHRAAEDARFRAELEKMTSVEAFGAQLSSKLTVDLNALRAQIAKGEATMAATEQEIEGLQQNIEGTREASDEAIRGFEAERDAVKAVKALVTDFEADAAKLAREVSASAEEVAHEAAGTRRVRTRIEQELRDARARLENAEAATASLDREVGEIAAQSAAAEKAAEAELTLLEDAASAAKLKAVLAGRMAALYSTEAEALAEQPALKLYTAKMARAEKTQAELVELKAQVAVDDGAIQALEAKELRLEHAELEARARAAQQAKLLEAQLEAARLLEAKQGAFLGDTLRTAQQQPNVPPAEQELLRVTIDFVSQQREVAAAEILELERRGAAAESAAAAATTARNLGSTICS